MHPQIYATGQTGTIGRFLPESVIPLNVRISETGLIDGLLPNLEGSSVIHLAAKVGHIGGSKDVQTWNINVNGTNELAHQAIQANAKEFLFISSSHVYANSKLKHIESEEIDPISAYGEQKASAEQSLIELFRGKQTKLIVARVFSVLDFGMNPNTLGGRIERSIHPGSQEEIPTALDVRDFMTPKNTADTLWKMCQIGLPSETYNICSGVGTTLVEATKKMASFSPYSQLPMFLEENSSVPTIIGDNSKLVELGINLNLSWDVQYRPQ